MKKFIVIAAGFFLACPAHSHHSAIPVTAGVGGELSSVIVSRSQIDQVSGSGTVVKILRDDDEGDRHQRFILRLPSGQTLLIAHNIDIAPRVSPLSVGDIVEYKGQYVWNGKGGVVHWTHHDPSGRHPAGWLKHVGQTFQ